MSWHFYTSISMNSIVAVLQFRLFKTVISFVSHVFRWLTSLEIITMFLTPAFEQVLTVTEASLSEFSFPDQLQLLLLELAISFDLGFAEIFSVKFFPIIVTFSLGAFFTFWGNTTFKLIIQGKNEELSLAFWIPILTRSSQVSISSWYSLVHRGTKPQTS